MSLGIDQSDDANKAKMKHSGLNKEKDTIASVAVHSTNANCVQLDDNGLQIVTREAIRREIWLYNWTIETKKLARMHKNSGKTAKEEKQRFLMCVENYATCQWYADSKTHFRKMD